MTASTLTANTPTIELLRLLGFQPVSDRVVLFMIIPDSNDPNRKKDISEFYLSKLNV